MTAAFLAATAEMVHSGAQGKLRDTVLEDLGDPLSVKQVLSFMRPKEWPTRGRLSVKIREPERLWNTKADFMCHPCDVEPTSTGGNGARNPS
jgi:hypothetical protein